MGAELNAGTDKETTTVYARMLDQHLPAAFDVMADMVWRPVFRDVDPERAVVLEEIAMYEDEPQESVFDALGEAVFGEHPLGRAIIGRAPVIAGTPVADIAAFHARRYVPGSVVVAAAGSVDHDAIVELAQNTLADLRAGQAAPRPLAAPARPPATLRFQTKDTEQVHICLGAPGLPRGDERRFASRVLDAIFGGLSSSRLFPGRARGAGPGLRRLLVRGPVRRHGPDRPLRRHAARTTLAEAMEVVGRRARRDARDRHAGGARPARRRTSRRASSSGSSPRRRG
jgi:predicted Zn-dependent peptidase